MRLCKGNKEAESRSCSLCLKIDTSSRYSATVRIQERQTDALHTSSKGLAELAEFHFPAECKRSQTCTLQIQLQTAHTFPTCDTTEEFTPTHTNTMLFLNLKQLLHLKLQALVAYRSNTPQAHLLYISTNRQALLFPGQWHPWYQTLHPSCSIQSLVPAAHSVTVTLLNI